MPTKNKETRVAQPKPSKQTTSTFYDSPKLLFWVTLGLFITSLLLTVINVALLSKKNQVQSVTPITPMPLNTPVSQGVVTITVEDVSRSAGKGMFVSSGTTEYIILSLTIHNRGDKPIQVLPTNDTYIKDQDGKVSYVTPYDLQDPFRAGELLPGEKVKGQLSYLVQKGKQHKLFIDAIWSGGVIPFGLEQGKK